jgi:DNA-binding transcriptional LysR family regulator
MLDRVTGMQVFTRAARLGSLSAAARALGMSPTMATKHVASIEQHLGVKLLHRTTRQLRLTEAGERYLEAAEQIIVLMERAETAAAADRAEVQGTLRLTASVSFGVREIAPLLPDFARLYPKVTVDLGLNDRIVDLVEEGWDFAIRIGPMADSTMIAKRLADCGRAVCAAPAYLAERGTPRRVAELKDHNCLGYTLSQSIGPTRWSFGTDGSVTVPVSGNFRSNNAVTLVHAAVAGQGVVHLPTFMVGPEIRAGELVLITLDHPTMKLPVFAVYPSDRRPPAKLRSILDFLQHRLGPVLRWDRFIENLPKSLHKDQLEADISSGG